MKAENRLGGRLPGNSNGASIALRPRLTRGQRLYLKHEIDRRRRDLLARQREIRFDFEVSA
jgi:hypothetical protein